MSDGNYVNVVRDLMNIVDSVKNLASTVADDKSSDMLTVNMKSKLEEMETLIQTYGMQRLASSGISKGAAFMQPIFMSSPMQQPIQSLQHNMQQPMMPNPMMMPPPMMPPPMPMMRPMMPPPPPPMPMRQVQAHAVPVPPPQVIHTPPPPPPVQAAPAAQPAPAPVAPPPPPPPVAVAPTPAPVAEAPVAPPPRPASSGGGMDGMGALPGMGGGDDGGGGKAEGRDFLLALLGGG